MIEAVNDVSNNSWDIWWLRIKEAHTVKHFQFQTKVVLKNTKYLLYFGKLNISQLCLVLICALCLHKTYLVVFYNLNYFFLHIGFECIIKSALDSLCKHVVEVHGSHINSVNLLLPFFGDCNCHCSWWNVQRIFIHCFHYSTVECYSPKVFLTFSNLWEVI